MHDLTKNIIIALLEREIYIHEASEKFWNIDDLHLEVKILEDGFGIKLVSAIIEPDRFDEIISSPGSKNVWQQVIYHALNEIKYDRNKVEVVYLIILMVHEFINGTSKGVTIHDTFESSTIKNVKGKEMCLTTLIREAVINFK